jgi:hypothetical protein
MGKRARKKAGGYRVFLSHSHKDAWISNVLCEKMKARGIEVWLDAVDLPGGGVINERVRDAMRRSNECLILLSPASRHSDWVNYEAGTADGMGKWTTAILFQVDAADLPAPMRSKSAVDIDNFEKYLAEVLQRQQSRRSRYS